MYESCSRCICMPFERIFLICKNMIDVWNYIFIVLANDFFFSFMGIWVLIVMFSHMYVVTHRRKAWIHVKCGSVCKLLLVLLGLWSQVTDLNLRGNLSPFLHYGKLLKKVWQFEIIGIKLLFCSNKGENYRR